MRTHRGLGLSLVLLGSVLLFVQAFGIHEGIAPPEAIKTGNLSRTFKYLTHFELERLGFPDRDLDQTRYLAELDLEFLASGGPPADGIPSIDGPRFETVAEANTWLAADQLVLSLRFGERVRAYPLAILNWHEIVNDRIDGTPVVVTYCPLCDSGLAFLAPQIEGTFAEFGTSGRLFRSDLVMYDRVTATFWEQFQGRPIVGPLVGVAGRLHRLPVDIVPYGLWRSENPAGEVLARPRAGDRLGNSTDHRAVTPEGFVRDYGLDPYAGYRLQNPPPGSFTSFGVPFNDDRLEAKDAVIGIVIDGFAKAYAREALLEVRLLNDVVGGVPLLVVVTPSDEVRFFERTVAGEVLEFTLAEDGLRDDRGDRWSFEGVAQSGPLAGTQLVERVATPSFWFAWVAFNPDTALFGGREPETEAN